MKYLIFFHFECTDVVQISIWRFFSHYDVLLIVFFFSQSHTCTFIVTIFQVLRRTQLKHVLLVWIAVLKNLLHPLLYFFFMFKLLLKCFWEWLHVLSVEILFVIRLCGCVLLCRQAYTCTFIRKKWCQWLRWADLKQKMDKFAVLWTNSSKNN